MTRSEGTKPEGDLSSVVAFSLLFLVPGALAVTLWIAVVAAAWLVPIGD